MIFFSKVEKVCTVYNVAKTCICFDAKITYRIFEYSSYRDIMKILIKTLEGHLVSVEKAWCGGVDCATGAGDV